MKKILMCDDDESLIRIIQYVFKKDDIEVTGVANGSDAFDAARETSPELILLDVMMPGKDGLTVLQELKSDAALRDIPVIVSSAIEKSENRERVLAMGGCEYVTKPFTVPELRDTVLAYLNRPRGRGDADKQ